MKLIITGISSGIGKALTLHHLKKGNKVIGIGRKNTISHPNLLFFQKDLETTTDFSFLTPHIQTIDKLTIINNAGTIGAIQRISQQEASDIQSTIQINLIAPMMLCQFILQNFESSKALTIINISSGAGKRPIPSWASYCASKAALDLFSQTIYLEEIERKRNIKVYSIAPGVVDTPMQSQIRNAKAKDFSSLENFIQLKEQNQLTNTDEIVKKIDKLLSSPYYGQVIYSLRDISI